LGSAALDLAYVATGRYEAFWEFNLNPWDTAAGILLVEEAGGSVTDFSGQKVKLDSKEVLATNGKIQAELVGLFGDMFAGRDFAAIVSPKDYVRGMS
jgi:myo-inositol-1(or 4)-monophosphatase